MGGVLDGTLLMPPLFAQGLDRWSPEDGDPAGPSLADDRRALIAGDEALGPCLELRLACALTRVLWMGETPLLPGGVVRLWLRARTVAGPAPVVRIAGRPGGAGGRALEGRREAGNDVPLDPRKVRRVSATAGQGYARAGLDMAWGSDALFGHFGFDVLGERGTVLRIDRLRIELVAPAGGQRHG